MLRKILLTSVTLLFLSVSCPGDVPSSPRLGVWITVFSTDKVLYSNENINKTLATCESSGITDIYLQVYRSDKAYYDSDITDRSAFETILASSGKDPIPYFIQQASSRGIRVHAWVNLLSLAQNYNSNIVKKYGPDVLTYDQNGRPSLSPDGKDELDRYYSRENQLFLEGGDWRVRDYLGTIITEILTKYPGFHGLHLDYIRYPTATPYIPGARFTSHGISYGYNRMNMLNFKKATGLDPLEMDMNRVNALLWDKWRRDQITRLAEYLSGKAREISPSVEISAAVVPSIERSYFSSFQNWTRWLDQKIIDSVIVMNYTDDIDLFKLYSVSLIKAWPDSSIQMGIGAYIMKDDTPAIRSQIEYLRTVSPSGIVIFSYDDISKNTELRDFLKDSLSRRQMPS